MRFLWLSLALLTGCNSRYEEYCEERTDCLDGNDADASACVLAVSRTERQLAAEYDCQDDYDEMAECWEIHSECEQGDYWTDNGDCEDEDSDYVRCIERASDIYGDSVGTTDSGSGE